MHEAGLARAIAKALRNGAAAPATGTSAGVRVLVTGGHHPIAEFDNALRFHLACEAPELDLARLELIHLPAGRLCTGCGRTYEATDPGESCPTCVGASLPLIEREQVEIELLG
jgi:Zn finger protein HypA/HybF involved in hydrogenase expression